MHSDTLEQLWKTSGKKNQLKVRFNDWNQHIKYFTVKSESPDGKRLEGILDSGEKMTYAKSSRGWSLYYPESEFTAKAV